MVLWGGLIVVVVVVVVVWYNAPTSATDSSSTNNESAASTASKSENGIPGGSVVDSSPTSDVTTPPCTGPREVVPELCSRVSRLRHREPNGVEKTDAAEPQAAHSASGEDAAHVVLDVKRASQRRKHKRHKRHKRRRRSHFRLLLKQNLPRNLFKTGRSRRTERLCGVPNSDVQ